MSPRTCAAWSLVAFAAAASALAAEGGGTLRPPAEFDRIRDRNERSAALFQEAAKVLQHPRCLNCHPVERQPTQGEDMRPHQPVVHAGPDNEGMPEMPCSSCHGRTNAPTLGDRVKSLPGAEHWSLAPASMAWVGFSAAQICEQLKDPSRNGNRTLAEVQKHMAEDHLVGWAWHPGEGREPAPGTQEVFGQLIAAWIRHGARCPAPEPTRAPAAVARSPR